MDTENLTTLIQLTLEKEESDLNRGIIPWEIKTNESKQILIYGHSDTLVDIFSNIQDNATIQKEFIQLLTIEIEIANDTQIEVRGKPDIFASTCPLAFYTLIRLGFIEEALTSLKIRDKRCMSGSLFLFTVALLDEEYTYLCLTF